MGCCLGILAEVRAGPERTFKSFFRREPRDQFSRDWKRQWSSSTREMENDAINYNYLDDHHPLSLTSLTEGMDVAMKNANDHFSVNQGLDILLKESHVDRRYGSARGVSPNEPSIGNRSISAITWNEMRRKWVGDSSKTFRRMPSEPTISWFSTYDDLLSTTQPFPQTIPLSEMVDFLVDIWHEEGLYD